jgi:hypothetical protein
MSKKGEVAWWFEAALSVTVLWTRLRDLEQ